MAMGPSYRVPYRRRREGKTDYKARRTLVLSRIPRLIVRGSLNHILVQIAEARPEGDKILVSAFSRELSKTYGWLGHCGNIPSAYLTGFLCGLRGLAKGIKKAILDMGLFSPTKGSRIFAALKGATDAGLEISCSQEKLPDDNRISGSHIAEHAKQLSTNNQETYQKQFSHYLKVKLPPEHLPEHFSQIKEKIEASFKPPEKKREIEAKPRAKPKTKPKAKPKPKAKEKTAKKTRKKKGEEK